MSKDDLLKFPEQNRLQAIQVQQTFIGPLPPT